MWWTLFTAADLYIGLIVLDAMKPSVAPEKVPTLQAARKMVLLLLAACGIVLLVQLGHRYGWLNR